jgi:hypothetical protein
MDRGRLGILIASTACLRVPIVQRDGCDGPYLGEQFDRRRQAFPRERPSYADVLSQRCRDAVMPDTPDVRPVGDLPNEIGKTAARELSLHGITSLEQVAAHSQKELLAIHGVGPKAVRILGEALVTKGLNYRDP